MKRENWGLCLLPKSFASILEIPFVDKSIDKNDKKPVTNSSTKMGRQKQQKGQKNRVEFIAKFFILCCRALVDRSVDHMDHKPKRKYC